MLYKSLLCSDFRGDKEINEVLFETEKPSGEKRLIGLFRNKNKNTYSFVNLTTGNITQCEFNTVQEAVQDLDNYVSSGKLKGYKKINAFQFVDIFIRDFRKEVKAK